MTLRGGETIGSEFSRPTDDVRGDFDQPMDEQAGQRSLSVAQQVTEDVRPYPPSWVDRLTGWVGRLPLPPWLFYLALGLGLTLLLVAVAWSVRPLIPRAVYPYYFLEAMTFAYLLALIHFLDQSAVSALGRFRPVMTVDDAGYHRLCYQLTTMPARPTLVASALGALYTFIPLLVNVVVEPLPAGVAVAPVLIVVDVASSLLIYTLVGVLVYHTFHQLSLVHTIYTRHTRINLFQPGPLYALSTLTALTAIGIAIPTYLWFQVNRTSPRGTSVSDVFQAVFLGIIVVVTFIWPLVGAHNRLEREKQRLRDDVGRGIEAAIDALQSRVDSGEVADSGALKEALDGLLTAQGTINRLRTWPWSTETIGSIGLTFLVPILIWIVQRVLERLGV